MKIGFIGLGNMGSPMVRNLIKAGHQLTVFDIVESSVKQIVEKFPANAVAAASPKDIACANLDLIITMLPASSHVRSVYEGPNGIFAHCSPNTALIDSSTIDPQTARDLATIAIHQHIVMLDAPVSGGTGGAEAATLTFMVGGAEEYFLRFRDILSLMGKNIVYCGGSGNGQVAKVVNNMLLGISMIGTAEAMSLGVTLGMDPKVLAGIINTSSGRCWSSEIYNPFPGVLENVPSSRGYTGGFGTDLMLKDLGLAAEAAKLAKISDWAKKQFSIFNFQQLTIKKQFSPSS